MGRGAEAGGRILVAAFDPARHLFVDYSMIGNCAPAVHDHDIIASIPSIPNYITPVNDK